MPVGLPIARKKETQTRHHTGASMRKRRTLGGRVKNA